MGYHWGKERRRGTDRRVARDPAYAGLERRVVVEQRQHPPEKKSWFGWAVIALVGFVTFDSTVWDGYYLHSLIATINADAEVTRAWSDNLW